MPAKQTSRRKSARELLFGSLWEFDPAPETAPAHIEARYGLFINGRMTAPRSGRHFASISPRDGTQLSEIAHANQTDVDAAFRAAAKAFGSWSKLPDADRAKYLFRIARLLQERAREFAVAETLDGGKPIRESRDFDLPMAAAHFFHHAGWADKLAFVAPGRTLAPLGPVAQVIPWNFPLLMLAWKIAPALAVGNTVVIKPAESSSITAMKFASILEQAELPAGVVNIVTGPGDTGAAVVNHPLAAKAAFTGSTEVGREIQRSLAKSGIPLTLELGGKAANIVFEDAPPDQTVEGIINGIFFNQGHVCCAGSRLLLQEGIARDMIARLRRRMSVLRVGDPLDKNTDVGAIHSREQLARIRGFVRSGIREGADIHQTTCNLPRRGFYFPPTLFTKVARSHRIAREEIFGPVLSVLTFRTPEEAVEIANNSNYGLSAGVWTSKGSRILKMAAELKAGVIWANTYNRFDPASPFGGTKDSGFGREGGLQGLLEYGTLV